MPSKPIDIKRFTDPRYEELKIEEWSGSVWVRELTMKELVSWMKIAEDIQEASTEEETFDDLYRALHEIVAKDKNGTRFDEVDFRLALDAHPAVLVQIQKKIGDMIAKRTEGLGDDDEEADVPLGKSKSSAAASV